eukprot:Skav207470  [mRNA]  locus=scaffold3545:482683:483165:- [translate_table: standard]
MGVSPDFSPWTGQPTFQGHGMKLTERTKDILNVVAISHMKATKLGVDRADWKGVYVDVSQNLSRKSWTEPGGSLKCLCTSTSLYSFFADRQILPLETLFAQGYPTSLRLGGLTQSDLKDFAGEGMCLPCIASVLWAVYHCTDFSGKFVSDLFMAESQDAS